LRRSHKTEILETDLAKKERRQTSKAREAKMAPAADREAGFRTQKMAV
jgi:hypothetical protein